MSKTRKKIICWNCDKQFEVEVPAIKAAEDKVYLLLDDDKGQTLKKKLETVGHKYIIPCPHCGKENEVRL